MGSTIGREHTRVTLERRPRESNARHLLRSLHTFLISSHPHNVSYKYEDFSYFDFGLFRDSYPKRKQTESYYQVSAVWPTFVYTYSKVYEIDNGPY